MSSYHNENARTGNSDGSFGLDHAAAGLNDLDRLDIRHGAGHLHTLGPRAVEEAMLELAAGSNGPAPVKAVLTRYGRLNRAQIVAAGAYRPLRPRLVVLP